MPNLSSVTIAGRRIAVDEPPYVVAELSANHNGSLANALRLVEAAKSAGADAVKLQTYRPDTITLDSDADEFRIRGGLWDGRTLYDLYDEAHTPWQWHGPIFERAQELDITVFSSPFDTTAVDLLEELGAPAYKIASFELVDLPLIRYVATTGKPLIISTGMGSIEEIQEAVDAALSAGCRELAILRCVSGYPAPEADYNLRTITDMSQRFPAVVGLSDHTLGGTTAIASVALGASIIEKHFTLDRARGGPDDSFSLEPSELAALCRGVRLAWESLGGVTYGCAKSEQSSLRLRRSLYFVRALKAGEIITEDAVRSVRPGLGVPPKLFDWIIGQKVTTDVARNTPVSLDVLAHP